MVIKKVIETTLNALKLLGVVALNPFELSLLIYVSEGVSL
jgi:hypothetical protein